MRPYQSLARPLLFRLGGGDPEAAHEWTLTQLERLGRWPGVVAALRRFHRHGAPARTVFGVRFPSPVGLAAGVDKDGRALSAWPAWGLGFVEVGTVTWRPQSGNPRPRVFRLSASEAIVNRMGFNNHGAPALAERLASCGRAAAPGPGWRTPTPLGISLGKSKVTPLADAVSDYVRSLRILHPYGDYFAINVSSPNTPGLRGLQDRAHLSELLAALQAEAREAATAAGAPKPLLVKIAPDLSDAAIGELLQVCQEHRVAGVIAVNTTTGRGATASADAAGAVESGGLSGRPLARRARQVVRFISRQTSDALPIIGVGGIVEPDDARRMFDAGASLVQVCTGLIYRGPRLVRAINREVARSSGRRAPPVDLSATE